MFIIRSIGSIILGLLAALIFVISAGVGLIGDWLEIVGDKVADAAHCLAPDPDPDVD